MKDLSELDKCSSDEKDEIGMYGSNKNGGFGIEVNGHRFFVISAAGDDGWEAVSIRPLDLDHYPTKEDVAAIKDMFFEASEAISTISVELFRLPEKWGRP